MMYTDAYPSAIRAVVLNRAAYLMRGVCRRKANRDMASCARHLVERCVCPCLSENDCIMEALVHDFVNELSALTDAGSIDAVRSLSLAESHKPHLEEPPLPEGLDDLLSNLRKRLQQAAAKGVPISYKALAGSLTATSSTNSGISRYMEGALETLMREDATSQRPFLATFVVDPRKGGLPAPAYFRIATELGRFKGNAEELDAWAYHAREFRNAIVYWRPRDQTAGVTTTPPTPETPRT